METGSWGYAETGSWAYAGNRSSCPTNHKLTPPRPSTPALLPRLSWYALLAAVVPPMAGGSHADVTYVYVGNSRRRRMEFSEKQRLLGDNATPVQVYYQRLNKRQLEIGVGKACRYKI